MLTFSRVLLDALMYTPSGICADQLVEQMHRLRAVRLQRLDDLLAGEQRVDLVAQLR